MTFDSNHITEIFSLFHRKGSDLLFLLAQNGIVTDANQGAKAYCGDQIVGKNLNEIMTKGQDLIDFASLTASDEEHEVMLQIDDVSGIPQSFYLTFQVVDGRILAFARLDFLEIERSRRELFSLTQNLSNMSRELHKKNAELTAALRHVKQLQGIIPICMHCHKIRNEKELWDRLETYIMHRSEAEFSHSICPECLEKHYPEEDI